MKLQRATRLALYAVLDLASAPGQQRSANEIAERYAVSLNHLAKVLRDLGQAGLVESVRGVGGGYRFAGNPKRITLRDVIEVFEPLRLPHAEPSEPGEETEIGLALNQVLGEIDELAQATLGSISLATMLKLSRRRAEPERGLASAG